MLKYIDSIRNMKKLCVLFSGFILCVFPVVFFGCNEKKSADAIDLPDLFSKKTSDHQVVVMLGSDYSNRLELLDGLVSQYGIAGSGGMVLRLLYPDSFTVNKKISFAKLSEAAASPLTTIIVTVGAPEGTVLQLAKIRNSYPQMQIISLLPMDEGIQLEAVSSLVIDYTGSGSLLSEENLAVLPDIELGLLIFAAVLSGEKIDESLSPLVRMSNALDSAKRILKLNNTGSLWKFSAYVDPETNLRSRNHLLLETGKGNAK